MSEIDQAVIELVEYELGMVPPRWRRLFGSPIGRAHSRLGAKRTRQLAVVLLDWLHSQTLLGRREPLRLHRPEWGVFATVEWAPDMRWLCGTSRAFKRLFEIRDQGLGFAAGVSEEERQLIRQYVFENYARPIITHSS